MHTHAKAISFRRRRPIPLTRSEKPGFAHFFPPATRAPSAQPAVISSSQGLVVPAIPGSSREKGHFFLRAVLVRLFTSYPLSLIPYLLSFIASLNVLHLRSSVVALAALSVLRRAGKPHRPLPHCHAQKWAILRISRRPNKTRPSLFASIYGQLRPIARPGADRIVSGPPPPRAWAILRTFPHLRI